MLIEQIKSDQIQARKNREAQLAQLLTTFYSEAAMIGKNDGDRATTDKEVQAVTKKFIKNANEVLDNLDDSDERCIQALFEIDVLGKYLPPQLSDAELKVAIETIVNENGLSTPKDMGKVMAGLKQLWDGQYDGKLASQLTREILK